MYNLIKSTLILMCIAILQLLIYNTFLKPIITTWGASKNEVPMPMAGDDINLKITSTRAILINAPKSDVWKWLIQLGADRNGFYSYTFIEEVMGYKNRPQRTITPEFKSLNVDDIIRGSINEKSNITPYNFKVLYVKPNDTFVLDKWGTFLLSEVNSSQTRLIIRTQEINSFKLSDMVTSYIMIPLHYIMERRTLMGIKERVEVGENVNLSQLRDVFWFLGIVFSGLLICCLVFIGRGIAQSFIIPLVFSSWLLFTILLFMPIPLYSIILLLVMLSYFIFMLIKPKNT